MADETCTLPPEGWYCTRGAGHDGPCAAHSDLSSSSRPPTMYDLAKRYVEAVEWNEEHPEDAHSEAGVEMALDYLIDGVKKRTEAAKLLSPPKLMDLQEFRDGGFLQEVNRCFFHPLGLALAVECDDADHTTVTGLWGIYDSRDDEEGYIYGYWSEDAQEKYENVRAELSRHSRARAKLFSEVQGSKGLVLNGIQPIGWLPPEEESDG